MTSLEGTRLNVLLDYIYNRIEPLCLGVLLSAMWTQMDTILIKNVENVKMTQLIKN